MWCCIHRLILSRQGRVIKAFTKSFLESAKITSEANEWPRCYLNLVLPWGPLWGSRAVHCKAGASEIKKKKKNWFTTLHLTLIQKLDLFTTNINV